jgi:ferredoxin
MPKITFLPDNVSVEAEVGEPILEVAERAGVSIPTGCLLGSCHACEVQLNDGKIICACISGVPAGFEEITVDLFVDLVW